MSAPSLTLPPVAFHVSHTYETLLGYAATCETCGASTPGTAHTRLEALESLHSGADIAA